MFLVYFGLFVCFPGVRKFALKSQFSRKNTKLSVGDQWVYLESHRLMCLETYLVCICAVSMNMIPHIHAKIFTIKNCSLKFTISEVPKNHVLGNP